MVCPILFRSFSAQASRRKAERANCHIAVDIPRCRLFIRISSALAPLDKSVFVFRRIQIATHHPQAQITPVDWNLYQGPQCKSRTAPPMQLPHPASGAGAAGSLVAWRASSAKEADKKPADVTLEFFARRYRQRGAAGADPHAAVLGFAIAAAAIDHEVQVLGEVQKVLVRESETVGQGQ